MDGAGRFSLENIGRQAVPIKTGEKQLKVQLSRFMGALSFMLKCVNGRARRLFCPARNRASWPSDGGSAGGGGCLHNSAFILYSLNKAYSLDTITSTDFCNNFLKAEFFSGDTFKVLRGKDLDAAGFWAIQLRGRGRKR
jgi:hypothetical protein